jgi:hypothetical protein
MFARRAELAVRIAGLEALRGERSEIDLSLIPGDVRSNNKFENLLGNERRKFDIEIKALRDELDVLRRQQPQFMKEREALDAEISAQASLLKLSTARYARLESLKDRGLAHSAAIMEPAQQEANARSSMARLKAQRSRNEIETAAVELKIVEKHNAFMQKVTQLLNDARRNLDETDIQLWHARKGLELRRQAAGFGSDASAGAPQTFVIQRLVDGKKRTIQGTAWTSIEPGDIVEVRNFDASSALSEAVDKPAAATGSTKADPPKSPESRTTPVEGGLRFGFAVEPPCGREGIARANCGR